MTNGTLRVWLTNVGLRLEHRVGAHVRVRVCIWPEGEDFHAFRGDFAEDDGRSLPMGERLAQLCEDFREQHGTLEELLLWSTSDLS
jgi:hypothetical protein